MDYAPDFPLKTPDVLVSAIDFVPTVNDTYAISAAPTTEGYTSPVAGADVLGAFIGKDTAGVPRLFAGTAAKLWVANGTTGWTDKSGAAYSANSWSFTQYLDRTVAADGVDKLQSSTSGGAFADLAVAAPTAKIVFNHQDALVALNTAASPAGWFRSDTGDPTNWTASGSNDVDSGIFTGGTGGCTAGREWNGLALAWKVDQMFRGIYVGTLDEKIRWDSVGHGFGCVGMNSHIATDIGVIFVSRRDILLYDGSLPRSIADKTRKTFFTTLAYASLAKIFITHNEPQRNIYIWYPTAGHTVCNAAFVYNYRSGKWGTVASISNSVDTYTSVSVPVVAANYADYNAIGGTTASTRLEANVVFAKPAGGAKLVNFAAGLSARNASATLTTGMFGSPDKDQTLSRMMPLQETGASTVLPSSFAGIYYTTPALAGGGRNFTGSIDDYGNGNCNVRGRYFQGSFSWPSSVASGTEFSALVPQYLNIGGGR